MTIKPYHLNVETCELVIGKEYADQTRNAPGVLRAFQNAMSGTVNDPLSVITISFDPRYPSLQEAVQALIAYLDELVKQPSDPQVIKDAEEFHKKATTISPEKLNRPFDI